MDSTPGVMDNQFWKDITTGRAGLFVLGHDRNMNNSNTFRPIMTSIINAPKVEFEAMVRAVTTKMANMGVLSQQSTASRGGFVPLTPEEKARQAEIIAMERAAAPMRFAAWQKAAAMFATGAANATAGESVTCDSLCVHDQRMHDPGIMNP